MTEQLEGIQHLTRLLTSASTGANSVNSESDEFKELRGDLDAAIEKHQSRGKSVLAGLYKKDERAMICDSMYNGYTEIFTGICIIVRGLLIKWYSHMDFYMAASRPLSKAQ